jgi:hypothetical protein
MKKISLVVYGLYGSVAILAGLSELLFPTIFESHTPTAELIHILREQGAALTFVGLISFWLLFNYDQRRTVHFFLTLFAFLIAGIHWFDYFGGRKPLASALLNSLGFVVLLALAIFSPRPQKLHRGVSC